MNTQALINLWNLTQVHPGTSGARAAAGVLLGLYNGGRFPLDLVELRGMDDASLRDAIEVIRSDAERCQMEVHAWLNRLSGRTDFGPRFEQLAHDYRRKGRCKKEYLVPLAPAYLVLGENSEGESNA